MCACSVSDGSLAHTNRKPDHTLETGCDIIEAAKSVCLCAGTSCRVSKVCSPVPQQIFECYGSRESGPLHGLRVNTPYTSKDHLQQKRYVAQSMGTTYAYDFLELFRQVRRWGGEGGEGVRGEGWSESER